MVLRHLSYIELPANARPGGFDHAAVHRARARLYVAHTVNDALDAIDCAQDRYLHSIPNLSGVAGALVSDDRDLVFTSNRGENTVGIFSPDDEAGLVKVGVGLRPNGLAFLHHALDGPHMPLDPRQARRLSTCWLVAPHQQHRAPHLFGNPVVHRAKEPGARGPLFGRADHDQVVGLADRLRQNPRRHRFGFGAAKESIPGQKTESQSPCSRLA